MAGNEPDQPTAATPPVQSRLLQAGSFVPFIDALLPGVCAAARVQLAHYRAGVDVVIKADRTPVTAADQESEAVLIAAIQAAAADIPIVAEESVAAGVLPAVGERFFLVDPLDGTKEFIARRDEFTINIALIEHGRPVFGLIYAPVLQDFYVTLAAGHSVHARLDAAMPPHSLMQLAQTRLSVRAPVPGRMVGLVSRSHMSRATSDFLAHHRISETRAAGSSLKFCLIAAGLGDVYPRNGPTSEWDVAAGHAILAAAGGVVVGMDGEPMAYGQRQRRFLNPDYVAAARWPLPR